MSRGKFARALQARVQAAAASGPSANCSRVPAGSNKRTRAQAGGAGDAVRQAPPKKRRRHGKAARQQLRPGAKRRAKPAAAVGAAQRGADAADEEDAGFTRAQELMAGR